MRIAGFVIIGESKQRGDPQVARHSGKINL